MKVRIYEPAKSAMQSGSGNSLHWVMEYELATPRRREQIMGWTSSGDTLNQVRMKFDSKEAAVAFAKSEDFEYEVSESHPHQLKPRNYIDNFKYRPFEE